MKGPFALVVAPGRERAIEVYARLGKRSEVQETCADARMAQLAAAGIRQPFG
jgi:hypothetical protein